MKVMRTLKKHGEWCANPSYRALPGFAPGWRPNKHPCITVRPTPGELTSIFLSLFLFSPCILLCERIHFNLNNTERTIIIKGDKMTTYITETVRFLKYQGIDECPATDLPKVLVSVRAKVSDKEFDFDARERNYTPGQWRALLAQPDVMHRYRKEDYKAIGTRS